MRCAIILPHLSHVRDDGTAPPCFSAFISFVSCCQKLDEPVVTFGESGALPSSYIGPPPPGGRCSETYELTLPQSWPQEQHSLGMMFVIGDREDFAMKATRVVTAVAFACSVLVVLLAGTLPSAFAHSFLRNYIQHRALITVGPTNIDLTLDLTFYDNSSMKERALMDKNHDGRVSQAEIQAYLNANAEAFERGLAVSLDDKPIVLVPLYEGSLDLMGDTRVGPHPHVLRLYFFARTPPTLAPGSVLTLNDKLWPETGALRLIEVNETVGCRFSSLPVREPGVWRARCQAVPARSEGAVPFPG